MSDTETLGLPWEWPERDESARALLQRIAIMNGMSPDELAERYLGVTQGAIARGEPESLRKFADMICCPLEKLSENSPVEIPSEARRYKNEKVALVANRKLRGVVLGSNLIGGENRRRICPECFGLSRHHRFWWEVLPITTCPEHRLTLATGCRCGGTATLRWTDAAFFCCRACGTDDLDNLNSVPASADIMAVDRYLLGRFGVMEADPVPMLDEGTFYDALDTIERIGAASIAGFQKRWQSAATVGRPAQEVRAVGFDILANGRLQDLLDRLLAEYRRNAEEHVEPALTSAYGWLYHWLNMKAPAENAPLMLDEFQRHADANYYLNGRARKTFAGAPDDALPPTYSLAEASKVCGISRETLRRLWVSMGLLRKEAYCGRVLVFDGPTVRKLAEDLKEGLNLYDTAKRLGIDATLLRALIREGMIKPAIQGGGGKHEYLFRKEDVEGVATAILGDAPKLLSTKGLIDSYEARTGLRLPTVMFFQLILSGRLKVRGRVLMRPGIRGALVDREELRRVLIDLAETEDVPPGIAATVLNVHGRVITYLVGRRILKSRLNQGETLIRADTLREWRRAYISLPEVANRLGCRAEMAERRLDGCGIPVARRLSMCGLVAYDRGVVEGRIEEVRKLVP